MRTSTKSISTSNTSNSGPRRRPMSTYLESRSSPHPQVPTQRSADNLLKSHHAPFQPSQPNMYPPPSEPAPPPPPRTVSQTAEALRRQALTDATSDVDTITVLQSLRFYSCPPHTHFRKHVTPHANICSPMHSSSTVPIAPKRKKRMTMFPEQLEDVAPPRPPKVCNVYIWVGNQRDL